MVDADARPDRDTNTVVAHNNTADDCRRGLGVGGLHRQHEPHVIHGADFGNVRNHILVRRFQRGLFCALDLINGTGINKRVIPDDEFEIRELLHKILFDLEEHVIDRHDLVVGGTDGGNLTCANPELVCPVCTMPSVQRGVIDPLEEGRFVDLVCHLLFIPQSKGG